MKVHMLKVQAIAQLMRLRTSLGAPALTVAGWWTLLGWNARAEVTHIVCSAVTAFSAAAFAQVYNDIRDVELDGISKPCRPIPSGRISIQFAKFLSIALVLISLASALACGPYSFLLSCCCLLISALYSLSLKRILLVGNVTVALTSSSVILFCVTVAHRTTPLLFLGQSLVFCIILGNEFYKSAEDADADARFGIRTLAIGYAPRVTIIGIAACWVTLMFTLVGCVIVGAQTFAAVEGVAALIPAGRAVLSSARAMGSATSLSFAGHRLWQWAWALGFPGLVLLR